MVEWEARVPPFESGDRVRVPRNDPHAPTMLWGKLGTVLWVGPLMPLLEVDGLLRPEDRQYVVRFDGQGRGIAVWESWLESA